MRTLLSPHYKAQPVTDSDMKLASLACGFTIGIGFLTVWEAVKQTRRILRNKKRTNALGNSGWRTYGGAAGGSMAYVWMIWLEILVCLIFLIICYLHLNGVIPPSFAFYFTILTTWALQVQFLLQIIINRISILLVNKRKAFWIKVGVATLITAINISVYCIWVPARLQVSARYIKINDYWDRCEKILYLIVDGCLNWVFISTVKRELVGQGLSKYNGLVKFNVGIVWISLSMDVLIISMMSLPNSFVYMQFHPLAYIVKLNIEMSMASLIGKLSRKSLGMAGVMTNPEAGRKYSHSHSGNHTHMFSSFAGSKRLSTTMVDSKRFSANGYGNLQLSRSDSMTAVPIKAHYARIRPDGVEGTFDGGIMRTQEVSVQRGTMNGSEGSTVVIMANGSPMYGPVHEIGTSRVGVIHEDGYIGNVEKDLYGWEDVAKASSNANSTTVLPTAPSTELSQII